MFRRKRMPRVGAPGRKRLSIYKCTSSNLNPSVSRNPLKCSQSDNGLKQKYPAVWEAAMKKAEAMGLLIQDDTDFDHDKKK